LLPRRAGDPHEAGRASPPRGSGLLLRALHVFIRGGPGAFLRRARRFVVKKIEARVPIEEALRRPLERERDHPADLRRLLAAASALSDPPRFDVVLVDRKGVPLSGEWREGIERSIAGCPSAALARETLREDAGGDALGRLLRSLTSEAVFLVRAGDSLRPGAIARAALAFREHPSASLLYGDEEVPLAGTSRTIPLFKPGWSPDLFRSSFFTGWPVIVRRVDAVDAAERLAGRGASALYELLLRLHEGPGAVVRLAAILGVRAEPPEVDFHEEVDRAMRGALAAWARERVPGAAVEKGRIPGSWRLRRPPSGRRTVSVIIPTRDGGRWLERGIPGVRKEHPLEILLADNGSRDPATLRLFASLEREGAARVLPFPGRFNFSFMMNEAARAARGEFLLFLNDDTEVLEAGSIAAMAEEADRPEIGAVGAQLLYPNGTIQHAGLVVGMGVVAGHLCKGMCAKGAPFFVSPLLPREVSAVDGACFLVRKRTFFDLGGFDAERLAVSFGDVDFCLRARAKGLRILYTPHAVFLHHETQSRRAGGRLDGEKVGGEPHRGSVLPSRPFASR